MTPAAEMALFDMLLTMHHVLIGGYTGSGKSVLINGIIYTLLQHSPNRRKMVLIDPKRVELYPYRRAPHCIGYADTPDAMAAAIADMCRVMDTRYSEMQAREMRETVEPDIYIVIDEMADLLDVCGKPALQTLKRILQLGRAAHIHVIAATQHVSRKTLPTELQINFPAIVALPQRSKIESRQMIGEPGAELLTVGNCLYITPQNHEPRRAAIPYIPDSELSAAVARWKRPEPKPPQRTTYQITPGPTPTRPEASRKRGFLDELIKNILYPKY